jgi:hypothetical protein
MTGSQVTPDVTVRQRQALLAGVRAVLRGAARAETIGRPDAALVRGVVLAHRVDRSRARMAPVGPVELIPH